MNKNITITTTNKDFLRFIKHIEYLFTEAMKKNTSDNYSLFYNFVEKQFYIEVNANKHYRNFNTIDLHKKSVLGFLITIKEFKDVKNSLMHLITDFTTVETFYRLESLDTEDRYKMMVSRFLKKIEPDELSLDELSTTAKTYHDCFRHIYDYILIERNKKLEIVTK